MKLSCIPLTIAALFLGSAAYSDSCCYCYSNAGAEIFYKTYSTSKRAIRNCGRSITNTQPARCEIEDHETGIKYLKPVNGYLLTSSTKSNQSGNLSTKTKPSNSSVSSTLTHSSDPKYKDVEMSPLSD